MGSASSARLMEGTSASAIITATSRDTNFFIDLSSFDIIHSNAPPAKAEGASKCQPLSEPSIMPFTKYFCMKG